MKKKKKYIYSYPTDNPSYVNKKYQIVKYEEPLEEDIHLHKVKFEQYIVHSKYYMPPRLRFNSVHHCRDFDL